MGGCAFTRGQLYKILINPIASASSTIGALHAAIIDRAVWDEATSRKPDPALIKLIRQAPVWWAGLATGATDITTIAKTEMVKDSSVSRVVRLNVLAPRLVDDILAAS